MVVMARRSSRCISTFECLAVCLSLCLQRRYARLQRRKEELEAYLRRSAELAGRASSIALIHAAGRRVTRKEGKVEEESRAMTDKSGSQTSAKKKSEGAEGVLRTSAEAMRTEGGTREEEQSLASSSLSNGVHGKEENEEDEVSEEEDDDDDDDEEVGEESEGGSRQEEEKTG